MSLCPAPWLKLGGIVAFAISLTACGNTISPPPGKSDPVAGACRAYAESVNPPVPKIYVVPQEHDHGSLGRCNIENMALAVHNEGEFRRIYGAEDARLAVPAEDVVGGVIGALLEQSKKLTCPATQPDCRNVFKILIFAHGGLVDHEGAVRAAEALAPGMMADGYAPLFLIWNSDFATAYADRLCCVLEGEENHRAAPLFWPVRLAGDIAASGARALENFGQQLIRFNDSVLAEGGNQYFLQPDDITKICNTLSDLACPRIFYPFPELTVGQMDALKYLNGQDQHIPERTVGYAATSPLRAATTVLLPEVGAEAWSNMVRRTRLALQDQILEIETVAPASVFAYPSETACARKTRLQAEAGRRRSGGERFHPNGQGAFIVFFDRLQCELEAKSFVDSRSRQVKVELHFYGHSMGALVGNELISRYQTTLPWRRIVYMAAATPVRDFKLMVAPLLDCTAASPSLACRDPADPDAYGVQFYSLMLHPLAESHDLEALGAVPSGSLLEWVDEMFSGPKSVDDRMLGKWTNAEKTMPWFHAAARQRMAFRVFPAQERMSDGDGRPEQEGFKAECTTGPFSDPGSADVPPRCHPIKHGGFADYSFWREDFLCGAQPCPDPEPPRRFIAATGAGRAAIAPRH